MKKTGTFQKLLSLVCTLAMVMAWLPILPAAAATPVLVEDFESTSIGSTPDTLVKSNQANGGTVSETVRSADGSKVLVRCVIQSVGNICITFVDAPETGETFTVIIQK